jgi:hypothetical protein
MTSIRATEGWLNKVMLDAGRPDAGGAAEENPVHRPRKWDGGPSRDRGTLPTGTRSYLAFPPLLSSKYQDRGGRSLGEIIIAGCASSGRIF